MMDDACRTPRSRGARARAGLDRVSLTPRISATRPNARSESDAKVGFGSAAHDQAGNIPAWALHPSIETSAAPAVPEDRPIAPDRAGTSSFARARPLLSVEDAAELLNLSTKTIRRLIARGRLRATRIGRAIRIQEADVEYLIARGIMS
jgi:excisionase family DNA binding protein